MSFLASDSPVTVQLMPLITTIVVFVIFVAVAGKVVWPKILGGLDERDRKLREDLDAAEAARAEASAAQDAYHEELAKARSEAGALIAQARQDAKAAAEELRSRNQQDLAEMKTAAAGEIESGKRAAIGELHAEASMLAVSIASRILGREINEADQKQLVESSLAEMAETKPN